MKKFFMTVMAFAAVTMCPLSMASCSDDDDDDVVVTPDDDADDEAPATVELKGAVSGTLEVKAKDNNLLTGALTVPAGATLKIEAGAVIKARQGFGNYILVERGGKIEAKGTATAPIIFTADAESAASGYWGGIIINGYAPLSGDKAGTEGATEIDNTKKYGGTVADDNSGTLEYVQILYSGARSSDEIEHNGLTLNGVGNGTTIRNVYILEGADDAIEFFGGSVNVSNLLAVNCDDDMFDFTQGYSGTLSNCYGVWESAFVSSESDPRGVEADGNLDGNGPDHTPQADFTIENMTIVNNSVAQLMDDAIKVRRGAKATIKNALVKGSGAVKNLVDLEDKKGNAQATTSIEVTNALAQVTTSDEVVGEGNVTVGTGNAGADASVFGWTGYAF